MAAVARFKVFTAEQLAEMFFDTRKRAQVRLHRLHQLGVLDRFQPYRQGWGSSPYHYVLGPVGAEMVAADAEEEERRPIRRSSATGLALGRPRDLARSVAVNGFYASLVGHARRHPDACLLDWMTAAEAARWSDGMVEPDAFGEWAEGDRAVEFFLLVDRGGPVEALVADLPRYERFEAERGQMAVVVFAFLSARRESAAQAAFQSAPCVMTMAVASAKYDVTFLLESILRASSRGRRIAESPRAWLYERRLASRESVAPRTDCL